ncbi:hypothetical protein KAR48_20585 [bacterium]|nr:hypothetical protein [bacterium]
MKRSLLKVGSLLILIMGFTAQLKGQDMEIQGAGVKEANGIYKISGQFKERPMYIKGNCKIIYKGCKSKWMLYVGKKNSYKTASDSKTCPETGWAVACGAKEISTIVPTFHTIRSNVSTQSGDEHIEKKGS